MPFVTGWKLFQLMAGMFPLTQNSQVIHERKAQISLGEKTGVRIYTATRSSLSKSTIYVAEKQMIHA
jgi:hypothetical protein